MFFIALLIIWEFPTRDSIGQRTHGIQIDTNRDNLVRRLDLYMDELAALREAIASDSADLKERFSRAQALHQDWLAGRAQGQAAEGDNPLPTTRSMLTGSLFGRFGRER